MSNHVMVAQLYRIHVLCIFSVSENTSYVFIHAQVSLGYSLILFVLHSVMLPVSIVNSGALLSLVYVYVMLCLPHRLKCNISSTFLD